MIRISLFSSQCHSGRRYFLKFLVLTVLLIM